MENPDRIAVLAEGIAAHHAFIGAVFYATLYNVNLLAKRGLVSPAEVEELVHIFNRPFESAGDGKHVQRLHAIVDRQAADLLAEIRQEALRHWPNPEAPG